MFVNTTPIRRFWITHVSPLTVLVTLNLFVLLFWCVSGRVPAKQDWSALYQPPFQLTIGILTTIDRQEKRNLLRYLYAEQLQDPSLREKVRIYFVIGQGGSDREQYQLRNEQKQFGDILMLDVQETGETTKTYAFFQQLESVFGQPRPTFGLSGQIAAAHRRRFYMKADDDAFLLLQPIVTTLERNADAPFLYYGAAWPGDHRMGEGIYHNFMLGMSYTVGGDLLHWMTTDEEAKREAQKALPNWVFEDQFVGWLLRRCNRNFTLINEHRFSEVSNADWHPDFDQEHAKAVALHLLKDNNDLYKHAQLLMKADHSQLREPQPLACEGACTFPHRLPF